MAIPSYQTYYAQSYRSDAMRELVRMINRQESYFADQFTYTSDMRKLGLNADPYVIENGLYSIDVVADEDTDLTLGYLLQATANAQQTDNDPNCKTMSINHLGQKFATDKTGNDSTQDCWY
ncbi:prepilin-type cleavage/methylation domain-containing protein [Catenovulum sp. 2E275]|nr:prepilin-type cleavage/methylation domain-containing protein [Catenovulum sp. 2E275]